jgi:hypothetical protein
MRWTNGAAELPPVVFDGFPARIEVVLQVGGTTQYPADDRSSRTAA